MIVYVILAVLVIVAVLSWLSFMSDRKKTNLRGPVPYPFIGNGHLLAVDPCEFIKVLHRLQEEYEDTVLIYLASRRYVLSSDPRVAEAVLTSNELITKGNSYTFLQPWLGNGLLTSTGQKWKAHRKFLTPAFHFNILQNFLPIFCKNGRVLRNKLSGLADGSSVDIFPILALLALDNVTESIMGVSVNAQNDQHPEYVQAVEAVSQISSMRMRNPFVAPDAVFNLLPYKTAQDKALKVLHGQTMKVISSRKEELRKSNITDLGPNADTGIKNKHAFLDLLLLAEVDGRKISDENIREEVDTFMFEGHDTTTSGITYCLYCLSNREDIQEKVFMEQKSIYGDDFGRDPTYAEIQKMRYLESVIKESLRLYPSVPIIERAIAEDSDLAGYHVPKGTNLVLDFLNMQRNAALYEDPLEFRPERFLEVSRNAFHWLPFNAGARNCIGQKFAMMEIKVTVAMVVNNFKILPSSEEPELASTLILRSRNGVNIKLIPRK
uniref:CYP4L18 protein n=1 Tax=Cnaphalocrocis medinalis TaxID=437488 RepID=C1LZ56_CNAME|nr:CYP4L18 protein [Cnaphalocrocis medinalis]